MTVGAARLPAALLLDTLGVYASAALFAAVFTVGDGRAPSLLAAAAAVIGATLTTRALLRTRLEEHALRSVGLPLSVMCVLAIVQLDFAGFALKPGELPRAIVDPVGSFKDDGEVYAALVALGFAWWRGIRRALAPLERDDILPGLAVGLVAVVLAALSSPAAGAPEQWGMIALAYALLAPLTLALFTTPDAGTPLGRFAGRWGGGGGALAVLVLLVAATTDSAQDIAGALTDAGRPAGTAALTLLGYVLFIPLAIIAAAVGGFAWLLDWLLPGGDQQFKPPEIQEPIPRDDSGDGSNWSYVVLRVLGSFLAVSLVVLLAFTLRNAFRRFARRDPRGEGDVYDDAEPVSDLATDARLLWRAFADRFRRRPGGAEDAAGVRALYRRMLAEAEARGVPRPPSATPAQFAPRLEQTLGSETPAEISASFAAARYGRIEPPPDELERMRARLAELLQRPAP